jgi:hypothetical protein
LGRWVFFFLFFLFILFFLSSSSSSLGLVYWLLQLLDIFADLLASESLLSFTERIWVWG